MILENLLHIICLIGGGLSVITLFANIFAKKESVFKKINTSVYIVASGAYLFFIEFLCDFLQMFYGTFYDYNFMMIIIVTIALIVGVILVLLGIFSKNENFHNKAYKIYELGLIILYIALLWNLLSGNINSIFLLPVMLLNFIFAEQLVINATEDLITKYSKIVYFTVNCIVALFWLIGIFSVITTSAFAVNLEFFAMLIIVLIISFSSLIFGFLISKENNND